MNPNAVDVLLVEDNPNDAELTKRELRKYNMTNNLVHVTDGQEALDFVFATGQFTESRNIEYPPRIILLDIKMPRINGIEVLQKIRANAQTKNTPVVILTSSNQDPDIQRCYDLGANSYIVKPVDFTKFSEVIRTIGFYWLLLNQPPV
jgi:CheY-like chemotaxis protein